MLANHLRQCYVSVLWRMSTVEQNQNKDIKTIEILVVAALLLNAGLVAHTFLTLLTYFEFLESQTSIDERLNLPPDDEKVDKEPGY